MGGSPNAENDGGVKHFLLTLSQRPLVVLLSSMLGAAALHYLREMATQAFGWFIPCLAIIVADLAAGVRAANWRGEKVRFSKAARRTLNKIFCYGSWIVCCVALNERYDTSLCAFVGMGIVFFIEGVSFFTNLLEPHGLKVSVKGLLKLIGRKHNLDNLEDVVEATEASGSSSNNNKDNDGKNVN